MSEPAVAFRIESPGNVRFSVESPNKNRGNVPVNALNLASLAGKSVLGYAETIDLEG